MAAESVESCVELFRGISRNAQVDGVPQYTRCWLVTTNKINAKLSDIAAAPGISWRASHPDNPNAYLVESSVQPENDSPFHYRVTYVYRYLDESEALPWNRPYNFTFSGGLASAPAFAYYSGTSPTDNDTTSIIVNSAGDPLQGLDRDEAEFTVTIQVNLPPPFNYGLAQKYVGAVNSDSYGGGAIDTWKCQSINATRKHEQVPNSNPTEPPVRIWYWDVSIQLAYRRSTWNLSTWDVGFNELIAGKRKKIYAGSDPVSEPVALNPNGTAKAPGQPPNAKVFRIYRREPFSVFPPLPETITTTGFTYPTVTIGQGNWYLSSGGN